MPGIALRIAASITVAPFSTSMVRVSPVWSTKWILAMMLVLPDEGRSGQSYNGSIRPALVRGDLKINADLQGVLGRPDQDRRSIASTALRADAIASSSSASACEGSQPLRIAASR